MTTKDSVYDAVVIGAGHTGLGISYYLKKFLLNHVVLEQGRIGDSWRNQRWDSFKLNTPNKINLLPGQENIFSDEEGFCSASEFYSFLERYTMTFQLPVTENSRVLSVECIPGSEDFSICASENGSSKYYITRNVVVASGFQNNKLLPAFAKNISKEIFQLHAGDYKNASLLPEGSVLIVGCAQSGMQIAEDLIENGRKIFVSTSQVPRFPRRYRGKDITDWLILTGFFDTRTIDVTDPRILRMKQPQVATSGLRGHTISLQSLAGNGAVILGKTEFAEHLNVFFQPDAADHIKFADESSGKIKEMINEYIQRTNINAPLPEQDIDDEPDEAAVSASDITCLNLKENKITSIIWTTGFTGDLSYLKMPVFNDQGILTQHDGISDIRGLYFLGLPWLRKRKSGIIYGIREDSEFLAEKLVSRYLNVT